MIDNRLAPYGAFALRASLGVMFIAHAYLKLAVFAVPEFEGFLGKVGLPAFLAAHQPPPSSDQKPRATATSSPAPQHPGSQQEPVGFVGAASERRSYFI